MSDNGYMSADALLEAFGDFRETDFTHPALRGKLRLREVDAKTHFEITSLGGGDLPQLYAAWAQAGIVHPQTKRPLLNEFQVAQLAEGRFSLLQDIANAVARLSRTGANDLERFRDGDDDGEQDAGRSPEDAGGNAETDG